MDNLLDTPPAGEVGHGPGRLLLSLEVSLHQDVDQRLQAAGVDHGLDLIRVAGSDVGDGPGALLETKRQNYNLLKIMKV